MHRQPIGTISSKGHLELGGCDAVELAREYGTPLLVLDEEVIRGNCRRYLEAFAQYYPNWEAIYAGKAFLCTALCRLLEEEKMNLDVVSGGELFTAKAAGFPMERVFFHGNNKSDEEVRMALDLSVGRIIVDNPMELWQLLDTARKEKRQVPIQMRITPGIKPSTHHYVQTGQWDSKFGFSLLDKDLFDILYRLKDHPFVKLKGFHCHIGSQIFEQKSFEMAIKVMVNLMAQVRKKFDWSLEELNLGGGLGIKYTEEDFPPSISEHIKVLASAVKRECRMHKFPQPKVYDEPGRSIIGRAGVMLYSIGNIKEIQGVRKYVSVDGGMADSPRVALYGARYDAVLANKAAEKMREVVTVAGKCCESGDILLWDVPLPKAEKGDILAVFSSGAYHYSMASNYNMLTRPAVVLAREGKTDLIIKRETYDDLIARHVIPGRLR
jgi:diaminopimelate decarboxylase